MPETTCTLHEYYYMNNNNNKSEALETGSLPAENFKTGIPHQKCLTGMALGKQK